MGVAHGVLAMCLRDDSVTTRWKHSNPMAKTPCGTHY